MLRPGCVVGGLRIDELLGRGAMGEVYRALQLSLKRPVAVKRIAPHLLDDPAAVARFEREAQCLARQQSPHVVAVYDFGRHTDDSGEAHWLLVMELVDGMSLGRLLAERGGTLDWRSASSLAWQAAEGLAAAGEFGVVHRDIKPDNLLVTRRGIAKLTDFGLAKAADSTGMTLEGTVLGTPLYMPPEACRGALVDQRGDLYSLGCTWFHCLAGRPPFLATSAVALLRAHLDEPAPDLRALAPHVPAAIAALVARLLAKDPSQRPASARALVGEIDALAAQGIVLPRAVPEIMVESAGEAPTGATHIANDPTAATSVVNADGATAARVAPSAPAIHPRRRWPLVALLAAGIAVLAVAGWFVSRPADPADGVRTAIAGGDLGLALQRPAALATSPGDLSAVAAVRLAVSAEAERLAADGRHDDALKRLDEHRARHPWLDTGASARDVAISRARWLVQHHRAKEGAEAFAALRTAAPDDLAICRATTEALVGADERFPVATRAAIALLRTGEGPLEPATLAILSDLLTYDSSLDEGMVDVRRRLVARHPAIVATVRPWLAGDDLDQRLNAVLVLAAAGALDEPAAIRHHWRNLTELNSTSYVRDSITWLVEAAAKPGWVERKRAAGLTPVTTISTLTAWNDDATAARSLLATAFLPEVEAAAQAWLTAEDEPLRWNAFVLLREAGRPPNPDAFHAATLATFHPLYESEPFTAALAWAASTPRRKAAIAALDAGIAHVEAEAEAYHRAKMGARERTCRQRLDRLRAARAAR